MLSPVPDCRVLLVGLSPALGQQLAGLLEPGAALLRVDMAGALAAAAEGAVALAILAATPATTDQVRADVAHLTAAPHALTVLVLTTAAHDADAALPGQNLQHQTQQQRDQALYQAGANDVLALSLAPVALPAKVARSLDLARRQLAQVRADRELRDARARLHATAAAAGLAMWSWDIVRDRVTGDDTMQFLFDGTSQPGTGDGTPAGATLAAYLRAIHPDDSARALADIEGALAGGGPYQSDVRVLARDGSYRHVISHGEVLAGPDGRPALLRGMVRDVTGARAAQQALDASEERYRTLFEAVDEGVCIIEMIRDADGAAIDYRFLEVNQAFVRHTGLANAVGKTILELVPGHDAAWMALYGEVARSGEPVRYQNDSSGAIARWFDVYAIRVGGAGSDRVAVLFSDISERRLAQLELERLAADLTVANRRKNEFIATLAHELRNPLAPLRSGLPLLRLGGDDAAVRQRVLGTMERQLGYLVELVDDLLDVGRITHGQIALKLAEVDLAEVIGAAVDAAGPVIEARRHRFNVDIDGEAGPLWLRGDATRLVQVLNNLLNNAAKYTAEGGQLSLRVRRDDGHALIEVRDNGAGIAPGDLAEVFDLFNQVGRDRLSGEGGLGIGLSLVRTLVELHGGTVSAASAGAGHGSTFTVRLPLQAPDIAGAPSAASPAAAGAGQRGHPVRVLVVDDNSDAADILAELLEMLGHSAQVANSGAAALEAMQDFRPQVVLLDLGMPEMNGYQVAEAIRNDRRFDQPLLAALTGWGGEQDRDQTRAAGFDLHLTKPVDLAVIEQVLAGV